MRIRAARWTTTGVITALVMALSAAVGVGRSSAASVGGIASAQITAMTLTAATGAPVVVAWENFNGPNGTNLNGTVTDGGAKSWSVNPSGASWTILTNTARSTGANTSLVINAGSADGSVVATVSRNGATTFDAGLTANRNSSGTQFLTVEWMSASSGSLELWKFNSGWTRLASVTNLYPGGIATAPASIVLGLTSQSTGTLIGSINGTSVVTATLSATDQTTYKNATHQLFGPYQWTSNGLRWDNFHVDNP